MKSLRRGVSALALAAAAAACFASAPASAQKNDKEKEKSEKPKITLTARPAVAIAPARVVLTAELVGGADDNEEYYCPTVRWEWGDLSSSESGADCEPYEAGKTKIKRRFTVDHTFRNAGSFKVYVRLKHGTRELTATSVTIKLQPGTNDFQ